MSTKDACGNEYYYNSAEWGLTTTTASGGAYANNNGDTFTISNRYYTLTADSIPYNILKSIPISSQSYPTFNIILTSNNTIKKDESNHTREKMVDNIIAEQVKAGGYDLPETRREVERWIDRELVKVSAIQWLADYFHHGFKSKNEK